MERERISYGLLSALSWGISTLLAAVAARRIGALRTVVIGEAAGLAGYWTLFLLSHFSLCGVMLAGPSAGLRRAASAPPPSAWRSAWSRPFATASAGS